MTSGSSKFFGADLIDEDEIEAVVRVVRSRRLFRYYGPEGTASEVAEYEREWASLLRVPHALAVNSGTSSLLCALAALGIGPGDQVIVPAFSWIATVNAIQHLGAVPVVAEVDESLCLDPVAVERAVGPRTRAVLTVHMRGAAADMGGLLDVTRRHGLPLVEDCCQASGASYRGRRLGTLGIAGCYSTQYAKLVSTGEGGVLVTSDQGVYRKAIEVHDCGAVTRGGGGLPTYAGLNLRCTELQAAVGRVQLRRLDRMLEEMRQRHRLLSSVVAELPGLEPRPQNDAAGDSGCALIAMARTSGHAASICEALRRQGVYARQLYRPDVIDLHIYASWAPTIAHVTSAGLPAPDCPRTLALLGRAVHLDVSPLLSQEDVAHIVAALTTAASVPAD
jgi:8-amino-3,8-dideoxy-alpha-D-manno-octulosonate transaminase